MVVNIRKVGEVADGSVTADKLATGAVDLGTDKVTGQAPASKIEDGAIINAKLADLAITTEKLQDNAISLAKAQDDLKVSHFVGDETEVHVTGTTETAVKQFQFLKVSGQYSPAKLKFFCTLKTTNASHQATLKVYFDSEPTARLTLNSVSTSYELLIAECDTSDVTSGIHTFVIKMVSADGAESAYNDYIEVTWVKG